MIRAGAQGYVTKTITGADLISSIKQVHEGYAVFSPKLAGFVLSAFKVCRRRGLMAALMVRHGLMMRSWTGCPPASRRSCG